MGEAFLTVSTPVYWKILLKFTLVRMFSLAPEEVIQTFSPPMVLQLSLFDVQYNIGL